MSDNRWRSANRRTFIKATGVAGAVGLAGCVGDIGGDGGEEEVRFILNPAESDVDMEEQYAPMFDYLESETGATIDPVHTQSYTETLQALNNDQGDIADTSPSAAVAAKDYADVVGIRVAYGSAQYFSLISTMPDSGIESLEDLEGELISMGSILSVSGTLVPMVMLKNAGLDVGDAPDGDPVDFEVEYSDHSTAKEQLINREEVVASSNGAFATAPNIPQEQFDELSQDFVDISSEYDNAGSEEPELKLLSVSDPLPRAPIMARANWDDDIREDVEAAILNATEEDLQHDDDYEGEELWFTGVEEGSHEDYEPIATVLEELGLEFEDLS